MGAISRNCGWRPAGSPGPIERSRCRRSGQELHQLGIDLIGVRQRAVRAAELDGDVLDASPGGATTRRAAGCARRLRAE
jgi:hypothetical protein